MRNLLLIPILLTIFVSFPTGCSHNSPGGTSSTTWVANGIDNKPSSANEDQFIIVQKHIGKEYESNFEEFRKITDGKQARKVKEILNEKKWISVSDIPEPPDYQFIFQNNNPNIKAKEVLYRISITPDRNHLVMVRGKQEYAQFTKGESEVLFNILIGVKISK
ncbi:hypothetical protein HPT25_26615 [Bacillus sp. BRMEA1]|uniref:hypothetical protein n=1 Tax=Neobacillus endophyticus TaxID=2738405 RepID=UPI001562EE04|nr:hypothetical protein [Neobacillus endophyticus]NRD80905.1 hypothetical protein [Neobacillus endophyticus]